MSTPAPPYGQRRLEAARAAVLAHDPPGWPSLAERIRLQAERLRQRRPGPAGYLAAAGGSYRISCALLAGRAAAAALVAGVAAARVTVVSAGEDLVRLETSLTVVVGQDLAALTDRVREALSATAVDLLGAPAREPHGPVHVEDVIARTPADATAVHAE